MTTKTKPPERHRIWKWLLGGFVFLVLGLSFAGYLFYEAKAIGIAENKLSNLLGADVRIGHASGLLTREVKLSELSIITDARVVHEIDIAQVTVLLAEPVYKGNIAAKAITARGVSLRVDVDALASLQLGEEAESGEEPKKQGTTEAPKSAPPEVKQLRSVSTKGLPRSVHIKESTVYLDFGSGSEKEGHAVPLTGISAVLHLEESGMAKLDQITGTVHKGQASASADVALTDLSRFDLQLKVADVSLLEAFAGTPFAGTTSGNLSAFFDLHGPGSGETKPLGSGWLDLRDARTWDLPLFSASLKTMGLKAGKSDRFKEGRLVFRVDRGYYYFREFRALGSPASVFGTGKMKLDGTDLEVDLVPRVSAGLDKLPVVGVPPKLLLDIISGSAVQIQVRGELGSPKISTAPVPIVTGPLKAFFGLFGG